MKNREKKIITDQRLTYTKRLFPALTTTKILCKFVTDVLERIFNAYNRTPSRIITDGESTLTGAEFKYFCENRHIELRIAPYQHHQSNPYAERGIRTIKDHLRAINIQDRDKEPEKLWKKVQQVTTFYNETKHPITGYSPIHCPDGLTIKNIQYPEIKPNIKVGDTVLLLKTPMSKFGYGADITKKFDPRHWIITKISGQAIQIETKEQAIWNKNKKWVGPELLRKPA